VGAGDGVFATAHIEAHVPVTLYPGLYTPPTPLYAISSLTGDVAIPGNPLNSLLPKDMVVEANSYCIHLDNAGGSLDAMGVGAGIVGDACDDDDDDDDDDDNNNNNGNARVTWSNGHMVAHKVNHPPKGYLPNVKAFDFKWIEAFNATNTPYLKEDEQKISQINTFNFGHFWYTSPEGDVVLLEREHALSGAIQLAGLVFVSTRPIQKGEEIFFDYKIEPSCWPAWYYPVDKR